MRNNNPVVYYRPNTLIVLALNLGVPEVANRVWLRLNFPTLARYSKA
jgi:hypothetical protein